MRANNEYYMLRKAPETSMKDHINQFIKLHQKTEYHKPPDAHAQTDRNGNLVFLSSLYDLKEWLLFRLAKGANIDTMTTVALFTEVKVYDATLKTPKITMETSSDQVRAFYSNIP